MSNTTSASKITASPSKADQVIKLLARAKGATMPELTGLTGWQPHSCRAFLTGLRKKGHAIVTQARDHNGTAYKIIKSSGTKSKEKASMPSASAPETAPTANAPIAVAN